MKSTRRKMWDLAADAATQASLMTAGAMGGGPLLPKWQGIKRALRKIGLISWGFLVGCAYTGFIIGLGHLN